MEINKMPLVSADVIAKLFGVSTSYLTRLNSQGIISRTENNQFELGSTVMNYITFLKRNKSEPEEGSQKFSLEQEKLLTAQLDREKAEIELELFKRNLHKTEHITFLVGQMIASAKAKLSALPLKTTPKLIGLTNKADIRYILETEIGEALTELSEFNSESYLDNLIEYEEMTEDEES